MLRNVLPCRRMHGPPVRRSPYASFIYTVSGGSAAALGQVPENTFALCPADGTGFLSLMQHMFCETVVLYTYEDGALHEQTLLYEVPVDQLPKTRPRLWMRWVPCLHMVPHLPGRRSFRSVPVRRFVRLQCGYCRSAQSRSERFLNFSANARLSAAKPGSAREPGFALVLIRHAVCLLKELVNGRRN